jgi:MSHA biogenesis protein MshO
MNARQHGFTLVEMIVVLTISVLVVGFIVSFVSVPVQAHMAQSRRADLAASAEAVAYWVSQDVRGALPNSVRVGAVGGRPLVEMIDVAAAAIYRDTGAEGDTLIFTAPDNQFDILGLPASAATHVVVNNLGTAGRNAYAMANVIAPANVNVASSTIALTPTFRFAGASPNRRAFLVNPASAVTRYECDLAARTLRRYDSRPIAAGIAAMPAGTPSRLIARDVTACTFTRRAGNTEHGGLLLMQVTISRVTNGATETLRVMKQLRVEDAA